MGWFPNKLENQTGIQTDGKGLVRATGSNANIQVGATGAGSQGVMRIAERVFTEANTATSRQYKATVAMPSGGIVHDVVWRNEVLWAASTSAVLSVGDGDDSDGYFTAVSLRTAPVSTVNGAGGISSYLNSTGAGAYGTFTKRYPNGGTITFTVVAAGTGAAGVSRGYVYLSLPSGVAAVSSV